MHRMGARTHRYVPGTSTNPSWVRPSPSRRTGSALAPQEHHHLGSGAAKWSKRHHNLSPTGFLFFSSLEWSRRRYATGLSLRNIEDKEMPGSDDGGPGRLVASRAPGGLSATSEGVLDSVVEPARARSSHRTPTAVRSHPPSRRDTLLTESATSGATG